MGLSRIWKHALSVQGGERSFQSTGMIVVAAFHNVYQIARLLLLVFGVIFLTLVRPDEQHLGEKRGMHVVLSNE